MYRIIETTDGKFKGRLVNMEAVLPGASIQLGSFSMKITKLTQTGDFVTFSNPNYVITAQEV